MLKLVALLVAVVTVGTVRGYPTNERRFKLCVPRAILPDCQQLMTSAAVGIDCVAGRDRMDCLTKVIQREADFVAVDPEDMYVAYHMSNQDFAVFTELRTKEEPKAEFRYDGIVLVRKSDKFRSYADLKGKKSCHTGYGRNVGYKIPITKLQRYGVFKLAEDPHLSPVEKELKGLSDLFQASCLVGKYSPNEDIDRLLKKRYANLCQLCEQPDACAHGDRFSGYDGAIRCLVENAGDVAFTKTIFVKKYFGLPVGDAPAQPPMNKEARKEDYVYLCEDGTSSAITDPKPCSWAQRPWQGYMGNGDIGVAYRKLQQELQRFYETSRNSPNQNSTKNMWVDPKLLLVDRDQLLMPGDHLNKAQYKDVIERDGPYGFKVKLCVTSDHELAKCDTMKRAAYSRDIRPEFQCELKSRDGCIAAVQHGSADVVVLKDIDEKSSVELKPILQEEYQNGNVMVAVAEKSISKADLQQGAIAINVNDDRANRAAQLLMKQRPNHKLVPHTEPAPLKILNALDLQQLTGTGNGNLVLVCPDLRLEPLTNAAECNLSGTKSSTAVFIRKTTPEDIEDNIAHAFTALSNTFGRGGRHELVFTLFGEYAPGQKDLIFHDQAARLVSNKNAL